MTTTTSTAKKTRAKSTKPERVGSVFFAKADKVHVDAALTQLGVKPEGSLAARVAQLNEAFGKLNETHDLYVCDEEAGGCGAEFTEEFELCPYCGMADDDDDEAPAAAANGKANGKGTALAKAPDPLPKNLAKFSDSDLDDDVKAIIALKQQTAICMWDLGAAIKRNYDREFWKLRRNDTGGPLYRNVKQFWAQELGFSHTYCYSLMEVAKHFKKADVKEVGTTKLALILRAPEKKRPSLLKAAKGGASKADIAKKVREANANADGGATVTGDDGAPRKRRISIAVVPGRKTVKLFAKPKSKNDDPKRARKMGDLPFGTVLFDNNTQMTAKLADKNGEWVLIVEFDRVK